MSPFQELVIRPWFDSGGKPILASIEDDRRKLYEIVNNLGRNGTSGTGSGTGGGGTGGTITNKTINYVQDVSVFSEVNDSGQVILPYMLLGSSGGKVALALASSTAFVGATRVSTSLANLGEAILCASGGLVLVCCESGITVVKEEPLYLSASQAGRATNVKPMAGLVHRVGIAKSASLNGRVNMQFFGEWDSADETVL